LTTNVKHCALFGNIT